MSFYSKISYQIIILSALSLNSYSQEFSEQDTTSQRTSKATKGFQAGLYLGGYWGNRSTAYLYDGYGFDINGQRNNFANSVLRHQIVDVFGGKMGGINGIGGIDLIAQLLNVAPSDWQFAEDDMPVNLRYTPTYQVGLNVKYQLDKKSSLLFHINGSKLNVNGRFTITTFNNTNNGLQNQKRPNEFVITGAEQRLSFQFGYQKLIGKNERLKGILEGGLNIILSKAQKNQIFLQSDPNKGQNNSQNDLSFDLMNMYNISPFNYYTAKYFTGVGIGVFAGLGLDFMINEKCSLQLIYNPSYDRIALGPEPNFKLQHSVGLRIYYSML